MPDDATDLIVGDAAVDALEEGRRGAPRTRKPRWKRKDAPPLTHCENCGTQLTGEWCAQCGQHAIDYRRSVWRVFVDALDSFLNWDAKFLTSVGVLLTKPWKLTNDFNAGRRVRYLHPLRLYLLGSIAFFLMFKLVNLQGDLPVQLDPKDRAEIAAALGKFIGPESSLTPDQQAKVESLRTRLTQGEGPVPEQEKDDVQEIVRAALKAEMKHKFGAEERQRLRQALRAIPEIPKADDIKAQVQAQVDAALAQQRAAEAAKGGVSPPAPPAVVPPLPDLSNLVSPPPAAENVPVPSPAASAAKARRGPGGFQFEVDQDGKPKPPFEAWLENRIKSKVGEDGSKGKLFLQTLVNNIPTMMLCCIPLFALVLKLLYVRKRRYYVEHLVYALHIHTFVYVGVTVVVLLAMALAQWSDTARALFSFAAGFAMFLLVFLSIRYVYREGWFSTVVKFIVGAVIYTVVLVFAVAATAFITLLLPE
jgi:ribosomal protein L32